MQKHKLTHLLNDLLTEDVFDTSNQTAGENVATVNKQEFLNSLGKYQAYSALFKQNIGEYKTALEFIRYIVDSAEEVTHAETDGWFDDITVSRHMKQMKEAFKVFEKTIMEAAQINQRLTAAYEDIGKTLQNYYDL